MYTRGHIRTLWSAVWTAVALVASLALVACGGGGGGGSDEGTTSGSALNSPDKVETAELNPANAVTQNDGSIDTSKVNEGVVMASATSASRLKFQVTCGDMSYNYDLPGDGTSITCPVNMGNGSYTFAIMRNIGGSNYVETASATADVRAWTRRCPATSSPSR